MDSHTNKSLKGVKAVKGLKSSLKSSSKSSVKPTKNMRSLSVSPIKRKKSLSFNVYDIDNFVIQSNTNKIKEKFNPNISITTPVFKNLEFNFYKKESQEMKVVESQETKVVETKIKQIREEDGEELSSFVNKG